MPLKILLTFTITVLSFFHVAAFSFASTAVRELRHSASGATNSGSNSSRKDKKISVVTSATKKMSGWFNHVIPAGRKKTSAKQAFGVASIILSSIGAIALFAGGKSSLIFFAAGIVFGITSLVLPRDKSEIASSAKGDQSKKKGGNTWALMGLLIPVALITALLIAYAI